MAAIKTPSVTLEYAIYGEHNRITIVLVQGLGMQLIDWPADLIEALAKTYRVLIFDNRDVGLSSKIVANEPLANEGRKHQLFDGDPIQSSYTLYDMAEDVIELSNALDINTFHIIGFSMGGMIAQIVAANYPQRVQSLVSLLSSGGQNSMQSTAQARERMNLSAQRMTLDTAISATVLSDFIFSGASPRFDRIASEAAAQDAIKRSYCPEGIYRQGLAIRATPCRQALLAKIRRPTLIIHGEADPCIHWQQALAAHELIEGSEFWLVKTLGHDFPSWFVASLSEHLLNFYQDL